MKSLAVEELHRLRCCLVDFKSSSWLYLLIFTATLPPPLTLSHSLSAHLGKTLLTTLKSQQTKPWTTGINSHQQITDLNAASFPEICNKLHMGTKCVPDARRFVCCSGRAVYTPRSVLCHQKLCSFISASRHRDILLPCCLLLHIYPFIFSMRSGETCDHLS